MEERKYEFSPSYGFIRKEYKRFNDKHLFKLKSYLFSFLKKIKIWYGTPAKGDNNLNTKAVLGIECTYKIIEGKLMKPQTHRGKIESNDVIVEQLELKDDDFFKKFYVCYDDIISYMKLESFKGKVIEVGKYDEKLIRKGSFNEEKNPHIIQFFYGFYDNFGLRAVGFLHVPKINMLVVNLLSILRLRHLIKNNNQKKEYWSIENNLKKLDFECKAIIKCVYLPDSIFSIIFKFLVG